MFSLPPEASNYELSVQTSNLVPSIGDDTWILAGRGFKMINKFERIEKSQNTALTCIDESSEGGREGNFQFVWLGLDPHANLAWRNHPGPQSHQLCAHQLSQSPCSSAPS